MTTVLDEGEFLLAVLGDEVDTGAMDDEAAVEVAIDVDTRRCGAEEPAPV